MEKQLTKQQIRIVGLLFLLVLGIGCGWFVSLWGQPGQTAEKGKLHFSQDSGFYGEPVLLEIKGKKGLTFYYTLDGSKPSKENENAILYEDAIYLDCQEKEQVFTVKCIGYDKKGKETGICSATYIVGDAVKDRYDIPVLAVSGNPTELLGEEEGIFAMGDGTGEKITNRFITGADGEREVTATLFDSQGAVLLSQNCGLRISGSASRLKKQPSFKLFARSAYDEKSEFHTLFFQNQYAADGTLVSECDTVLVRNAGNDNGYAFLRSELASDMCRKAGYQDVQSSSPVCVYINGEYYGPYWFVTDYNEEYFEETYGNYDGQMLIYEGTLYEVGTEGKGELYAALGQEYNEKIQKLRDADFTDPENVEALDEILDTQGYLEYMALMNYLGNMDTLGNNYKIYRYYTEGEYLPGTVFDGRFHILLFDLDVTLGLTQADDVWVLLAEDAPLSARSVNTELFDNMMKNRAYREYYVRYSYSLVNHTFSARELLPMVEEKHAVREKELRYACEETQLLEGSWNMYRNSQSGLSFDAVEQNMEQIREYIEFRPGVVAAELAGVYGYTMDSVSIRNLSEASITMDFATFHDTEVYANYLEEVPITLTVTPKQGDYFAYWLVNGTVRSQSSITLTQGDVVDGIIEIECVCMPDPDAGLIITAVKSQGTEDFIELTNVGMEEVNLGDYRLTDDEVFDKSTLPFLTIDSGESIRVYGKHYTGAEALGCPGINFSIKEGETVSLYYKDGSLCNQVEMPKLGTREGVYTMDRYTGTFREELPES